MFGYRSAMLIHEWRADQMELDQIEAFVAIVRRGSFTGAGAALALSQPAVSRRIDLLEHELAAPVFERTRGGVRLTEAGRAFLPYAETLLASMHGGIGAGGEPYTLTIEGRLAAAGLGGAEIIPIDSLTAQKRMVEAGFGLGLFPVSSVDEELRAGTLRTLPVRALQATIDVVLIHRRRAYLSGAAQSLMTALSQWDVSDPRRATRRRR